LIEDCLNPENTQRQGWGVAGFFSEIYSPVAPVQNVSHEEIFRKALKGVKTLDKFKEARELMSETLSKYKGLFLS